MSNRTSRSAMSDDTKPKYSGCGEEGVDNITHP